MRTALAALWLIGCPKQQPPPATTGDGPPPTLVTDANSPVHERVNEAADLIEAAGPADLERAIRLLSALIDEDPSGVARFNLGVAYHLSGDLQSAANQYQAVIAVHPDHGDAWLYLGRLQEQQGQRDSALNTFRTGMTNDPEHMGLRVALVAALRSQGRSDEAILAAKEALKVNANSLPIYNNFALAYIDKGDTTLARFILQKALQSVEGAVNNAYLHTNVGWSYYLDGNKAAAVESLEKAVELDPELVPALMYLSRVYLEDRNYEDMVVLLERAETIDPTSADVQLNLGIAYRGVGRLDDAKAAYEKAMALDPANPDPHFNLGILLGDYRKDYEAAVGSFNQYIAGGGGEAERAMTYIDSVVKEKERAERRARAEADRQRREAEKKRREEVLRQAEDQAPPDDPDPAPADGAPADGAPDDAPADDAPDDDAPAGDTGAPSDDEAVPAPEEEVP